MAWSKCQTHIWAGESSRWTIHGTTCGVHLQRDHLEWSSQAGPPKVQIVLIHHTKGGGTTSRASTHPHCLNEWLIGHSNMTMLWLSMNQQITPHKQNERPDRRSGRIYPALGRIYAPHSIGPTPLYYITGYPMVSHRTPTYFHSGDDTYTCRLESTRIHHANAPATNRTPTISLLSTRSLAMPVVSSHSTSMIIH